MPVKLHGVRRAEVITPLHPNGAPPAGARPAAFKSPFTVGRVLYFGVLVAGLAIGGRALYHWARYATATGVLERDVDRLAPRERGRITRVDVQPGDAVKRGQPLVWLDYSAGDSGYVSEAQARVSARVNQLEQLRGRRQETAQKEAMLKTQLAASRSQAAGLAVERRTLERSRAVAARLQAQGAATESEVMQAAVKLAEVEQLRQVALAQAAGQERALAVLRRESRELDRAIAAQPAAPEPAADAGIIAASRDGVVAWVAFHAGEVVGPDNAVVLLADSDAVRVRAFVQPKDAQTLAPGRAAEIQLPTGEWLHGEVRKLHLLASLVSEQSPAQLGRAAGPALTTTPLPPVDPNGAFLIADVTVTGVAPDLAARLVVGAPCEVRVARSLSWLWGGG